MTRAPRQIAVPLRDHGTPARVDRIWRRLSSELPESGKRRAAPVWASGMFAAAFGAVAVFGAGVFVGAKWLRPDLTPMLSAEPPSMPEPAAGLAAPAPKPVESASTLSPKAPLLHKARGVSAASRVVETLPSEVGAPEVEAPLLPSAGPPEWERLAEAGDFDAARAVLDASGGFEAALSKASAAELMTLVDIGRASGSREQAIAALRRVVEAYRAAPEAPLAAWTLGNLLDQAGDDTGAAEAFGLYRRLSPGGDFAEDALAHEVARALGRGDLELSARLVAQYENEFPNGPRLEEFRTDLAKRVARSLGTEASAATAEESAEAAELEAAAAHSDAAGAPKVSPK